MQDGITKDILQIIDNASIYVKHELNNTMHLENLSEDNFIYISDIENRVRELMGQNNIS